MYDHYYSNFAVANFAFFQIMQRHPNTRRVEDAKAFEAASLELFKNNKIKVFLYFELLPELLKDCNRPVSASITGIKRVS
jgi:hypothetical protein